MKEETEMKKKTKPAKKTKKTSVIRKLYWSSSSDEKIES